MRWPQRCLGVLFLIPAVAIGCGGSGSGEGRVLVEGKNLGEFEVGGSETADRGPYRYVITKVEVFEAGKFSDFPPGCGGRSCTPIPGEWPVVLVYLRAPVCETAGARPFCVTALHRQCLGTDLPLPTTDVLKSRTYVWWKRDTAGRPKPHVCLYYAWVLGSRSTARDTVMAFIPHVNTPPTRLALVVEGRSVPIRFTLGRGTYEPTNSSPPPAPRTGSEPVVGKKLCTKPGIRYTGTTEEGAEVCFTLTPDRSKWVEIGFRLSCLGTGEARFEGPARLAGPGQINQTGFTATIRGAQASGVIEEPFPCKGKTFKWTAHRAP